MPQKTPNLTPVSFSLFCCAQLHHQQQHQELLQQHNRRFLSRLLVMAVRYQTIMADHCTTRLVARPSNSGCFGTPSE